MADDATPERRPCRARLTTPLGGARTAGSTKAGWISSRPVLSFVATRCGTSSFPASSGSGTRSGEGPDRHCGRLRLTESSGAVRRIPLFRRSATPTTRRFRDAAASAGTTTSTSIQVMPMSTTDMTTPGRRTRNCPVVRSGAAPPVGRLSVRSSKRSRFGISRTGHRCRNLMRKPCSTKRTPSFRGVASNRADLRFVEKASPYYSGDASRDYCGFRQKPGSNPGAARSG